PAGERRELTCGLDEEVVEGPERELLGVRAVGVGDAAAEVHRLDAGEVRQQCTEDIPQARHVLIELADLRARAYMRMQSDNGEARGRRERHSGRDVLVPDAVLRGRSTRVASLDVAVAEARVDAHRDGTLVAGLDELADLARRADVRQHALG